MRLTNIEIEEHLKTLPNWKHEDNTLHTILTFDDFKQAFAMMTQIAFEAEALQHHPDWSNSYNTITIRLSTHDAGHVVTIKDIMFAKTIHRLQQRML